MWKSGHFQRENQKREENESEIRHKLYKRQTAMKVTQCPISVSLVLLLIHRGPLREGVSVVLFLFDFSLLYFTYEWKKKLTNQTKDKPLDTKNTVVTRRGGVGGRPCG